MLINESLHIGMYDWLVGVTKYLTSKSKYDGNEVITILRTKLILFYNYRFFIVFIYLN
jgi:hypothetical protein